MKIQGKKPRENVCALRFMMSIFGCQHKYPVQFNVERSFLSAILVKSVVIILVAVFFQNQHKVVVWVYTDGIAAGSTEANRGNKTYQPIRRFVKQKNSHLWKQRRKVAHVYVDQFLLATSYIAVKCVCLCEVETAKRRPKQLCGSKVSHRRRGW